MKRILGLDLGTNSIGWALVNEDFENRKGEIKGIGSRIIPMSQDVLDKFSQGQSHSQTSERTGYRGVRRLQHRHLLRRERLHRVLNILGFLPEHYAKEIDFEKNLGQFIEGREPKINYYKNNEGKYNFLFMDSFLEMVSDFKEKQPELFYKNKNGKDTKIPYDWTLYYLRKKALTEKISKEELAWLILNFNQKRGYYQLRGEEEEEAAENKEKTFEVLEVKEVTKTEDVLKKTGENLYDIYFTNDWKYDKQTTKPELWEGKTKEFIVTTTETKSGEIKRTYKTVDSEKDWIAIKEKSQQEIDLHNKQNNTVGVADYIYTRLLQNPNQKIKGELIRTVERYYYKEELYAILNKQKEYYKEFHDKIVLWNCIIELYKNNYAQQQKLKQQDLIDLIINDIIFFQRPLKSKKSTISGCQFEKRPMKDKHGKLLKTKDGKQVTKAVQAISKSHPLYQEFRLWQFVNNIRIYKREQLINGKLETDVDVTNDFISDEKDIVVLFDFFNSRSKINQKVFLAYYKDKYGKKLDETNYRWNYVEEKEYPLNETRSDFIKRFKKVEGFDVDSSLTLDLEIKLWHIVYSVKDKIQYKKALNTFAIKYNENANEKINVESFIDAFVKFKPFDNDYGTLSEKAIKKLLPLMRMGKYWNYDEIDDNTKSRIQHIITGEYNEKIRDRVREKTIKLETENHFKGLPLWLASYVVYDRHAESNESIKWHKPEQIDEYLKEFKQHSLRNPIVEQVVTETLRTVRDIWKEYGDFDEIHIELGREMKNPADKRKKITAQINKNQETNQRIRNLLNEFADDKEFKGVIPHSPSQQEKLKIFEDGVLSRYTDKDLEQEIIGGVNIGKVAKSSAPSTTEIQKYKLWLEQKYRSPYTGEVIPLSKLFTNEYEIEHVIPQARYFDDSFGNKIICETEVNKVKGNQTAFEFISHNPGLKIELGKGKSATLFDLQSYQDFVSRNFQKGSKKFKFLLSEDIPEQFIARQLNDTRYISKLVKALLSNIVRDASEQEAVSKNLVSVTGGVTSVLKKDWGLEDKWNRLILPRFKRLNQITKTNEFTYLNSQNIEVPDVPEDLKKGFSKKRIDHRHHALDALVVALATRNHVSYLNNEHAKSKNKRYDLRNKLRKVVEIEENGKKIKVSKDFYLPWKTFPVDAQKALEKVVVSFKQNIRVINKATNKYQVRKNDKIEIKTQKGKNFAIRKSMHKETVSGRVKIRDVKKIRLNAAIDNDYVFVDSRLNAKVKQLKKAGYTKKQLKDYFKNKKYVFNEADIRTVKVYFNVEATATRVALTDKFTPKQLEKVTDTGIRKILEKHTQSYVDDKGKPQFNLAFNAEGIEQLNKNIVELNTGKFHYPIYKVRLYEVGNKFSVSEDEKSAKSKKYVEAAKGTNLFFAIYWDTENEKRVYETVPLNEVIEHQKEQADFPKEDRTPIPVKPAKGKFLFSLSPNDLVYVPTDDERNNPQLVDFSNLMKEQTERIYKMVSSSTIQCFFIKNSVSKVIVNKIEFTVLNKSEKSLDNLMIKERCWKLNVNRLGKITDVIIPRD